MANRKPKITHQRTTPTITHEKHVFCVCGYEATNQNDLNEHILAMMHVFDGSHHIERRR